MKTAIDTTLLKIAIGLGVSSALLAQVPSYTVSTLLGNYNQADQSDTSPVISPYAVAVDAAGDVYFTDTIGNRVRMISATTGAITTVAGDGSFSNAMPASGVNAGVGGPAVKSKLYQPTGLCFDPAGNLYISDGFNSTIDKVDTTGIFTYYAGLSGIVPATGAAYVSAPSYEGNTTYYSFSGDGGLATQARIRNPQRCATDSQGNLYIADKENNRIRRINATASSVVPKESGPQIMQTIVGGGGGFSTTGATALPAAGALGADGGPAVLAVLGQPEAVALDSFGNIYIADTFPGTSSSTAHNRVRMVSMTNQIGQPLTAAPGTPGCPSYSVQPCAVTWENAIITTIVGGGSATQVDLGAGQNPLGAILSSPAGLAIDGNNNVYISDRGNNRILYLNQNWSSCSGTPVSCSASPQLTVVLTGLGGPSGLAFQGSTLYIAETTGNRISSYNTASGTYTILEQGSTSPLFAPRGIAVNPTSGAVVVADTSNQRIISIPKAGGSMTQVAGLTGNAGFPTAGGDEDPYNPVQAVNSKVSSPWGGAFDLNGNYIFADKGNNRVRMITPTGVITTIAGGFFPAAFSQTNVNSTKSVLSASVAGGYAGDTLPAVEGGLRSPSAVAVDNVGGNNLCAAAPCYYIADTGNNTVRCVGCLSPGVMTTVAGTAPPVSASCPGSAASLNTTCSAITETVAGGDGLPATDAYLYTPQGVAVDSSGNLYIADTFNYSIRVVNSTTGIITTLVGSEFAESGKGADGTIGVLTFLDSPVAVAVGSDGAVYIAEGCIAPAQTNPSVQGQNNLGQCLNSRIRRWDPKTNTTSTISAGNTAGASPNNNAYASLAAGSYADGISSLSAIALVPTGVAVDSAGNVYFTDATNRVRVFTKH